MKKLLLASTFVLALGGCDKLVQIGADICAGEQKAHTFYITWVAPFRPADKVALELSRYNKVMALCATGASPSQIDAAKNSAAAARQ